jgi:hypothetical protein
MLAPTAQKVPTTETVKDDQTFAIMLTPWNLEMVSKHLQDAKYSPQNIQAARPTSPANQKIAQIALYLTPPRQLRAALIDSASAPREPEGQHFVVRTSLSCVNAKTR